MNFQLSLEKKINKFGQKAKILEKNENAHEIRKKRAGLCPGVISMSLILCAIEYTITAVQKLLEVFFSFENSLSEKFTVSH